MLKAYFQCRKNKRRTFNAAKFEWEFEKNLLTLEKEILNKTYNPKKSICFVVEFPIKREVFAADFRDRVVHHLIYNHTNPIFERKFIHHSYACRVQKGTHLSLKNLNKSLKKITKNHKTDAFFLHLDIKSFFMSIDKDILYELLKKHCRNKEILYLIEKIIFHKHTKNFTKKSPQALFDDLPPGKSLFKVKEEKGLPIGNLTSQFFANVYLNELDQFVKHQLKVKYYFRYVDDFLLLAEDRKTLVFYKEQIENFLLEKLDLRLNPKKEVLANIKVGIDWVGYFIKPECVLVRKRVVKNFKNKLFLINSFLIKNQLNPQAVLKNLPNIIGVCNSYYGHFKHADSFKLRRELYEDDFGLLKNFIMPKDKTFLSFIIRPPEEKITKKEKPNL